MKVTGTPDRLLIATKNPGKVKEFVELLSPLRVALIALGVFPEVVEPEETGANFAENAALKASYYARQTGEWAMADDSGLVIDALDGLPGVHSARFGGVGSSYPDKMRLVLEQLGHIAPEQRAARFVSVIILSDPTGTIRLSSEATCEGSIADAPRGSEGFGYDPIFVPAGYDRTFGEMSSEEKGKLSHRAKAAEQFIRQMLDFTGV